MAIESYDVAIIGGGPGGYVAAIRASQLGMKVVCIEKRDSLGGTCLNVGCIPSKALLESSELFLQASKNFENHGIIISKPQIDVPAMIARKDKIVKGLGDGISSLFKKNKVNRIIGSGRLVSRNRIEVLEKSGGKLEIDAKFIIIATGSEPASLPCLPMDGEFIVSSSEALNFKTVPKDLVVVGAGYIGLEMGSVWTRLGTNVQVLEFLPKALPLSDSESAALLQRSLEKQGLNFNFDTKVTGGRREGNHIVVECEKAGKKLEFKADKALVCVGRKPNSIGLGLESLGIIIDPRTAQIKVDQFLRTSVPNIYAIGDLVAGPMLAHKAEEEGVAASENIAGGKTTVNHDTIPSVIYTWPELSSVGKTEEQLKEAKVPYKIGKFPFIANSRARTMGESEGTVKILAHENTDRILGVHIFGPRASDMIAEAVAWIEMQASSEDIARTCHAHPSLSEAFKEAAMAVEKKAIHI
jgi:dihydrolipoamide dehydrogenase